MKLDSLVRELTRGKLSAKTKKNVNVIQEDTDKKSRICK